jgi:serine/threonine protein kinase
VLDLSINNLGDVGALSLGEALKTNSAINSLNLSATSIESAGAIALAEAFKLNTAIASVDLSQNNMTAAGVALLADSLKVNKYISSVKLNNNGIGDVGATSLADAFKLNSNIKFVDLSGNRIGDAGAISLASALTANVAIATIDFGSNHIGSNGSAAIAKMLKVNRVMSSLALVNNYVGDSGAGSLAEAFKVNSVITSVKLSSNSIGDAGAASLAAALKSDTAITSIDLSNNSIGTAGAASLANALTWNPSITLMDLNNNDIGTDWTIAIAWLVKTARSRSSSNCRGVGVISRSGGKCQCSGLALLDGDDCSDIACVGAMCVNSNDKHHVPNPPIGSEAVVAVVIATTAVGAGIVLFCFLLRVYRYGGSAPDVHLASKFVAVARERAEARFVIEYRQLVQARTMVQFRHDFEQLEVPRSSVQIGAELGRGQSGVVYLGAFTGRASDLAIKTRGDAGLDVGGAAAVADEALMLEAMLLNGLRHSGIVALLGVVTTGTPVLVCTELMENGNLRDHLRANRPHQHRGVSSRTDLDTETVRITTQDMIVMAAKLSSAMAFLEQRSIIHRDIAARNVLVGKYTRDVKMADLGAARNVHRTREGAHSGVYKATSEHSPARWMALEALREAKFSHKSDVFAFGVLLWEILSFGQTPWGAFAVSTFSQALANGERLAAPLVPANSGNAETRLKTTMYTIAMRCWRENPVKRPHFHQLEAEFAVHCTVLATSRAVAPNDGSGQRSLTDAEIYPLVGNGSTKQSFAVLGADGYVAENGAEALGADGYVAENGAEALGGDGYFDTDQKPALDTNGYVTEAIFTQRPNLDCFGYVVGGRQQAILDDDGYVANVRGSQQATLDADGYVATIGGSQQATLDGDGYVANVRGSQQATLDADGYVATIGGSQQATLDDDGYVATIGDSQQATLDADGYVAGGDGSCGSNIPDTNTIGDYSVLGTDRSNYASSKATGDIGDHTQLGSNRSSYASSTAVSTVASNAKLSGDCLQDNSSDALGTISIPNGDRLAAPSRAAAASRTGIAARSVRKPSVYLGFEEGRSSTSLHDDETRL